MNPKKKSKGKPWKKIVIALLVIALAAGLILPRFRAAGAVSADQPNVVNAQAQIGDITSTISGSGTLTAQEAEKVTVPEGVEIEEVYVSAGDRVTEGDALALVDGTSVKNTLSEVQSNLEDLDEQLTDKKDDKVSSSVTAGVAGRVKIVYCAKGDSVAQLMGQQGALMVLSLDGKMAVDIDNRQGLAVGDEVTVTLSDGKEKDGTIADVSGASAVVTLTDNGPQNGDTVSVTKDGEALGEGTLYIHNPLKVTGYTGTVSSVKVKENQKVSASTTLVKLSDLGHTAEYDALLARRNALADQMQDLTALAQNPVLFAPFTGTVQSVEKDSTSDSSSSSSGMQSDYSSFFQSAQGQPQGEVLLLTAQVEDVTTEAAAPAAEPTDPQTPDGGDTTPPDTGDEGTNPPDSGDEGTNPPPSGSEDIKPAQVSLMAGVTLSGGTLKAGQFQFVLMGAGGVYQNKSNDKDGKVTFDPITLEKAGSYEYNIWQVVNSNDSTIRYDGKSYKLVLTAAEDGNGGLAVTCSPENPQIIFANETVAAEKPGTGDGASGGTQITIPDDVDTSAITDAINGAINGGDTSGIGGLDGSALNGLTGASGISGGSYSFGGMSGISASDYTSASGSASSSSSSSASTGETTVLSLSPDEKMTVTMTVDELDILSIQVGQTALVTVDAITDQTFEGTVTSINTEGTAAGGVTKYQVELTLDKTEQMLPNMNASVEITVEQAEGCLLIPSAALQQEGRETFVYTSYDEETGELGGRTTVETGLSDGTNTVVTSGLSEGDTVCYTFSDAGNNMMNMMFGMGGMNHSDGSGPNGGMRPAMGN